MSELPWGTEVAEETRPENQPESPAAEPGTLALSADEFSALEERVLRAVNLVKRERAARNEAEERALQMEIKLEEQTATTDQLQKEIGSLRSEREQVKQRVERLLSQLDALEL